MTALSLAVYVGFVAIAGGWRTWLQYRRTGDYGLRRPRTPRGSLEWFGSSCLVLGLVLAGLAPVAELGGVLPPSRGVSATWLKGLGLALALCGFGVTVLAQVQMRDSWRVGVDEQEKTELVTRGLYRHVRNPIFSGMLLLTAGMFLMAPNALSAVAFGSSWLGLEVHVRRVEEPYLLRVHGSRYLSYARSVGRFFPYVGRL